MDFVYSIHVSFYTEMVWPGFISRMFVRNSKMDKKERIKMAIVDDGKRAVTHYEVLEEYNKGVTLVKCTLETGRTHQIRVHALSINHPLLGDEVYGPKNNKFKLKGQILHAKKLGFIHPTTKEYVEFEAPLPEYFKHLLEILD